MLTQNGFPNFPASFGGWNLDSYLCIWMVRSHGVCPSDESDESYFSKPWMEITQHENNIQDGPPKTSYK